MKSDTRDISTDYLDLMDFKRNPNYGRTKCFHCLLSPERDDPIFIGINRLVAKGLLEENDSNTPPEYPCPVANRFECPYDCKKGKISNTKFDVEDLFELANMAFAVEIAIENTSTVQIKNKQDLCRALTDRETLYKILEQALCYLFSPDSDTCDEVSQSLCEQYQRNKDKIVEHFMTIKDNVKLEELRFY
ncbi:MAG: hypothetical protein WCA39_08005, partial [Nitrososphaeraceae archaeon]